MITIKKEIERIDPTIIEHFKKYPPSDFGHSLHYNLIGSRAVKPLIKINAQFAGQAITVRITPNDSILVYKAMELARPGDIIVIDMNGEDRYACWGEITTKVAIKKGIVAAIINGPVTDSLEIEKLEFPVYAKGISPMTTKVYCHDGDINTPITIDHVVINPGDIIVGDNDGVLVIPRKEAETYLSIGKDEFKKDQDRKKLLEETSVEEYLKKVNAILDENKNIKWL